VAEKILAIDDDRFLLQLIQHSLEVAGYQVTTAFNGQSGLQQFHESQPHLVILDLMMPQMDGWETCHRIRSISTVPIIMLTALGSHQDVIRGLKIGADDYLVKPFAFVELLARVRTLLRRGSQQLQETTLQLADLELDLLRRRVQRQGKRIDLTAKEFALLELLLRRSGEVLPKSLIASQVWDMNFDSDTNVIEVAIRRLRAKVDDDYPQRLIHTVRGMGYVLEERDE